MRDPTRLLLGVSTGTEALTGLAVVVAPSLVTRLLFGGDLGRTGLAMAPVAGFALLTLSLACWPSRAADWSSVAPLRAMLLYNVLTAGYLIYLGVLGTDHGVLLWPAGIIHAVVAVLLAWVSRGKKKA